LNGPSPLSRMRAIDWTPRLKQASGLRTFGTKSFEFWTLLAVTLWSVRPRSVLELGSGRSTSYIGEYAMKEGVPFVSVEQNRRWARRIRLALRAGLVDGSCVKHVPVRGDWYDAGRLDVLAPSRCEMVFVDGPVGVQESLGGADRAGVTARRWLTRIAMDARVVVVDDVHRSANLVLADELAAANGLSTLYLAYAPEPGVHNVVAVSVEVGALVPLREICAAGSIAVADDPVGSRPQWRA
jgi:hypothetical protein